MRKALYLVPLLVLMGASVFFFLGLQRNARELPSVLIDRPVPDLDLPPIPGHNQAGFASKDLIGQVTLVNIFGSWCIACLQEHPFLMTLSESKEIPIYGIDWKDKPDQAMLWLKRHGNPYERIGYDPNSKAVIDFGVTGAPETFIVDKQGIIRYRHVGPMSEAVWQETLQPIIESLRSQ